MPGVDLERQLEPGLNSTSRHMMKSSKSLISAAESSRARASERFGGAVLGNVFELKRTLVGERRLQADRPCPLGLLKQTVEDDEIIVERLDLDPRPARSGTDRRSLT